MRGFKLRAWQKRRKEMFEVAAIQFREPGFVVKKSASGVNLETWTLDEVELMEYVGRLDRHDIEMCEGDIIEYIDNTSRGLVKKIVVINDIRRLPDFSCSKWEEIIGNIYENSELLPVEEKRVKPKQ